MKPILITIAFLLLCGLGLVLSTKPSEEEGCQRFVATRFADLLSLEGREVLEKTKTTQGLASLLVKHLSPDERRCVDVYGGRIIDFKVTKQYLLVTAKIRGKRIESFAKLK
jgi:hypothetical protein